MSKKEEIKIADAVDKSTLQQELTEEKFLRHTNYGNNELYIISAHNAPNVMHEIGRLREISFRMAGGGTGKELDIDHYDTAEQPYQQLIVWQPRKKEIIGGYRFLNCNEFIPRDKNGKIKLATTGLFNLSEDFENNYMPFTIELGRSFIQPEYQAAKNSRHALFSLDNLWDGLGALLVKYPNIRYLFGKITMYLHYNQYARNLILYFLEKYFWDNNKLVYPKGEFQIKHNSPQFKNLFTGNDYKENFKILNRKVRDQKEIIPPLFNSYMNLSPSMKVFGTAINNHFGGVEETGIMITIDDIYTSKKHRHISTYNEQS